MPIEIDWTMPAIGYATIVREPNYLAFICCWISVNVNGAFERTVALEDLL